MKKDDHEVLDLDGWKDISALTGLSRWTLLQAARTGGLRVKKAPGPHGRVRASKRVVLAWLHSHYSPL